MAIVQQNSGTWTGTSFTPTLTAASAASSAVVVIVAGNTTVTTPTNWRTSATVNQVNIMGHYLFDRAGVSLTSIAMTSATGQGTWWIAEIANGVYDASLGANAGSGLNTVYNTPSLTPTAGTRIVIASLASTITAGTARTVSGWTNGFIEQADLAYVGADSPMQGVAALIDITASGSTAYSTTTTYSTSSNGRSAIIASYATGAATASTPPDLVMAPIRR